MNEFKTRGRAQPEEEDGNYRSYLGTHFYMLYCADKHKMACFVFTAYRCCLRALFLLSAALCCFAHTADLRQEEADDNQKQTRSTLQKTCPMRNMYVRHAAML